MKGPPFYLQIVDGDGVVLRTRGGSVLERDFGTALTDAIVSKGVGIFKTEAKVKQAIIDGIAEVVDGLKRETSQLAHWESGA